MAKLSATDYIKMLYVQEAETAHVTLVSHNSFSVTINTGAYIACKAQIYNCMA